MDLSNVVYNRYPYPGLAEPEMEKTSNNFEILFQQLKYILNTDALDKVVQADLITAGCAYLDLYSLVDMTFQHRDVKMLAYWSTHTRTQCLFEEILNEWRGEALKTEDSHLSMWLNNFSGNNVADECGSYKGGYGPRIKRRRMEE